MAPGAAHAARLVSAAALPAGLADSPLLNPEVVVVEGPADSSLPGIVVEGIFAQLARPLEVADPYPKDGPLIPSSGHVASTSMDKVLYYQSPGPHGATPTKYFVYSLHSVVVVQLPDVPPPEILMPHSIGIVTVRNNPSYDCQIAHLRLKPNPTTGLGKGFLVRWNYLLSNSKPDSKPVSTQCVEVELPLHNYMKWKIHRVISSEGIGLLWPDLKKGILRLRLANDVKFDLFDLPKGLPSIGSNPWRSSCPEQFRSVGCCNGVVSFVNLHTSSGANHTRLDTNIIEVGIWNLENKYGRGSECTWKWIKKNEISTHNLDCRELWNNFKGRKLPPWPKSVPSFPILSKNKSGILHLIVEGEKNKQAWLLQLDMQTKTLKNVFEYPGYCIHKNPPFPSDLS